MFPVSVPLSGANWAFVPNVESSLCEGWRVHLHTGCWQSLNEPNVTLCTAQLVRASRLAFGVNFLMPGAADAAMPEFDWSKLKEFQAMKTQQWECTVEFADPNITGWGVAALVAKEKGWKQPIDVWCAPFFIRNSMKELWGV